MSLMLMSFEIPRLKIGLGGNYYVICDTKEKLVTICNQINKSVNSIYFNKKYNCWAIKIKRERTKQQLLTIMSKDYIISQ